MVYSQERLQEALDVIKADIARREREFADKYARTHYRDDFHLRNHSRPSFIPGSLCRDSGSDLEDEDYSPFNPKSKNRKFISKREVVGSSDLVRQKELSLTESFRKRRAVAKDHDHKNVFLTLKFEQSESKALLQRLASRHQTYLNQWVINKIMEDTARSQDDLTSLDGEDECDVRTLEDLTKLPSRLRNGKLRPETVISKDAAKQEESFREPLIDEDSSDSDNTNSGLEAGFAASDKEVTVLQPGSSIQTAIMVDDESDNNSTTDPDSRAVSEHDTDGVFTIHTAFCHPIDFKCAIRPCSFCKDYRFGVVGHGLRRVTVARGMDGQLVELGDGHGQMHAPTGMCISCALDRMMITRCHRHTMCRIEGSLSIQELNVAAYGRDLISRDPERSPHPPPGVKALCLCCPSPATFKCGTLQKQDERLNPVRDPGRGVEDQNAELRALNDDRKQRGLKPNLELKPPILGCGLTLCEKCSTIVDNNRRGQLIWAEILDAANRKKMPMKRADIEFLFKHGALWKAYN